MQKTVHLEVNDNGAWRRVMSFDAAEVDDGDIEHLADQLLRYALNPRLRARIIIPGDTAPLLLWSAAEGWRAWREVMEGPQKRAEYHFGRGDEVLEYISTTPRTMAEVIEQFGTDRAVKYAVYNLVKRGLVINLRPRNDGKRTPGLFVAVALADCQPKRGDAGHALAKAWGAPG